MDKKKKKVVSIIILIILVIIAVLVFIFKPTEVKPVAIPDPYDMDNAEVGKFIESRDFNSLSAEERNDFINQISGYQKADMINNSLKNIQDEKARRKMRNMMHSYSASRVDKFFNASPAEQEAMLDQDIDRFNKAHMLVNIQTRMTGSKQIIPQGGAERAEFDASINPATKAKMRIYMERMRQRRKQLGR